MEASMELCTQSPQTKLKQSLLLCSNEHTLLVHSWGAFYTLSVVPVGY